MKITIIFTLLSLISISSFAGENSKTCKDLKALVETKEAQYNALASHIQELASRMMEEPTYDEKLGSKIKLLTGELEALQTEFEVTIPNQMRAEACNKDMKVTDNKAGLKMSASKTQSNCEVVTEQYTICNGVRYVLDLKNNDGLKRDTKKIEEYIDSGKLNSDARAVQK